MNLIFIILNQVSPPPAKNGINLLDYYPIIALALNLTYMPIVFNSWYFK